MFNYISVEFPGTDVPPQRVHKFTLKQERYAHETATVLFRDWDVQYDGIKPGYPVKVLIRSTEGSREFIGYVHHISPKITPGRRFVEVSLIGASYKLKQAQQRTFLDVTADQVVKTIATENNFSYFVESHPRVFPMVAQAGHTNLELLARLARQCGYTLRFTNTSIYFRPLMKETLEERESALQFSARSADHPQGSSLYYFNATIGESMQHSDSYKASYSIGSVDLTTGSGFVNHFTQPSTVSTNTLVQPEHFDAFATKIVTPDASAATYELEAIDALNNFPYRALVSVIGTPSLRPDMPVYLDGLGPAYSGYWTVIAAEHRVAEESTNVFKYVTNLVVGSDSLGKSSVSAPAPTNISIRVLNAGKRNVPPDTTSKLVTNNPAPNMVTQAGFSITKANRASEPAYTIPYWASSTADLNAEQSDPRLSPAALNRLGLRNVI